MNTGRIGRESAVRFGKKSAAASQTLGGQMPGYCPPASGYALRNHPHPTFHAAISDTFLTTVTRPFRILNFEPWPGFEPATSQPRAPVTSHLVKNMDLCRSRCRTRKHPEPSRDVPVPVGSHYMCGFDIGPPGVFKGSGVEKLMLDL
ncbi:hypothetical protein C0J45_5641 [Silurus meridionalis]|nr:hypothetical protein C0J45_5641 [Silurus meridionalis]